jgi:hypothetical protein
MLVAPALPSGLPQMPANTHFFNFTFELSYFESYMYQMAPVITGSCQDISQY